VHHRASRHGCLPPTASTFPGRAISLQGPAFAGATGGADEALRPTTFRQITRTRFLIAKAGVERLAGHRPVIFPSARHVWNNTGTLPIIKPGRTTSCAAGSKGISLAPMHELIDVGAWMASCYGFECCLEIGVGLHAVELAGLDERGDAGPEEDPVVSETLCIGFSPCVFDVSFIKPFCV
jgi:hypothetical protein